MCGIVGRVNRRGRPAAAQLDAMSALVAHRGPDEAGRWRANHAGLAHRRLAIVDRAGGKQPITGEGDRVVLVYNGEVYNHDALRAELTAAGHTFHSRCDTEAILHAHEEWGAAAPARLRGMFAYAAWDRLTRTLTLARDHLGVKPLYYAALPSGDLLFASELKPLLVEPAVDRGIDPDALACYLALRYVPAPLTILRGVRKLPPGCTLTWRDGAVTIDRYWHAPVGDGAAPPTWAEAGGRLVMLLDEVVDQCRMSDVPLGAFLSGGLDSTLTAGILARLCRRDGQPPPHTFAVGYEERESELQWAALAADRLGTRHHEVIVRGADVAAALPAIIASLDEPLGDPSAAPMWFLARRAREEVTVVLSGEGADEVFAGYAIHGHALRAARWRALPWVRAAAALASRRLPDGRLRRAARLIEHPLAAAYRGPSRSFDLDRLPWGRPGAVAEALAPAWNRALRAPTALGALLAFDQQVWLPDDILLKSDRTTMAHSLELRPPLLDHLLVDEVASWPDAWKLDGGVNKRILRRAAEGVVPREILDRPKVGFATPAGAWLRGALADLLQVRVAGPGSLAWGSGELRRVHEIIAHHRAGRDRTAELWPLLTLEIWRQDVLPAVPLVAAAEEPETPDVSWGLIA